MPLWTPAQLGSSVVRGWWKADSITGVSDGAAIAQWDDSSGNGQHASQVTEANRPTFHLNDLNGLPGVRFNDSNDLLVTASLPCNSRDETWVFVIKTADAVQAGGESFFNGPSSGIGGRSNFINHANGRHRINSNGVGIRITGNTTLSDNTPTILGSRMTSNSINLYFNGADDGSNSNASAFTNGSASTIGGVNTAAALTIYEEVFMPTSTSTTADFQKVEGYLAWKWGLQASLVAGHPYKSAAPTVSSGFLYLGDFDGIQIPWPTRLRLGS